MARKKTTQPRKSPSKRQLGKYKSGLEKECADQLRLARVEFEYEKFEYVIQDKFIYPNTYLKMTPKSKGLVDKSNKIVLNIKYTPDFVDPGERWIIETKGYVRDGASFPLRWKIFMKWLIDNNRSPHLFIVKNKNQIAEAVSKIKELLK
tara:strand:+ start:5006 stop:5452 length:447 start_codon:yes stop_codon:yes gene_type:complete